MTFDYPIKTVKIMYYNHITKNNSITYCGDGVVLFIYINSVLFSESQ